MRYKFCRVNKHLQVESNLLLVHTMERRVWCAIAGQDRLLNVDTKNCEIVYDLKKAAVDLSQIKIPYPRVDMWKVCRKEATLSQL